MYLQMAENKTKIFFDRSFKQNWQSILQLITLKCINKYYIEYTRKNQNLRMFKKYIIRKKMGSDRFCRFRTCHLHIVPRHELTN